jgi:hypothetical protein
MRRSLWRALAFLLVGASQVNAATPVGSNLADHVAASLRRALPPNFEVIIVDPLTIKVGPHGVSAFQLNLDRLNSVCAADPDHCGPVLEDFVSKAAQFVTTRLTAPSREQLRAVLRPVEFVDQIKQRLDGHEPVAVPFVGGLAIVCYIDTPTVMGVATDSTIKSLGFTTTDEAIALCKRNVKAALPPLQSQLKKIPDRSFGTLTDDPYQSSRLIFHDDWAPVAAEFGGHLIVAVPASDVVVYGKEQDEVADRAMATVAKKMFEQAHHPVSTKVFRWTPAGWAIAVQ